MSVSKHAHDPSTLPFVLMLRSERSERLEARTIYGFTVPALTCTVATAALSIAEPPSRTV